MRLGEKILGLRLLQLLLQPFYRQFVAGAERSQLNATIASLRQENIRFMMTSMLEADVGEALARWVMTCGVRFRRLYEVTGLDFYQASDLKMIELSVREISDLDKSFLKQIVTNAVTLSRKITYITV